MNNIETILKMGAKGLGISLNNKQINMFKRYMELLKEWNQRLNLTAITDDLEIAVKHFIDSLTCAATGYVSSNVKVIDVGTGAGFPGIPLKIAYPEMQLVLLDSLKKRIEFLDVLVRELGLNGVTALHGRAEDIAQMGEYRETFDLCLSRAVAHLSVLSEYCIPFIRCGGTFLAMKGPGFQQETQEARNAVQILGGEIEGIKEFVLPETDITHFIVIIKKIGFTPSKYPRKAGKPAKKPL